MDRNPLRIMGGGPLGSQRRDRAPRRRKGRETMEPKERVGERDAGQGSPRKSAAKEAAGAPVVGRGGEAGGACATVLAATLSDRAGGREGVTPSVALRDWIDRLVKEHGGIPSWRKEGRLGVLWGGAKSRESDPERATRAALALRDGILDLREKGRHTLTLRIGIGTGSVFRGADAAEGEGSMEGAAVKLAAALEAKAPPDGILLSESTYRHVRGVFDVVPQEPMAAQGGGRTEGVYLLDRAKPRPFRMPIRGVGNIETRTIGRERELAALQECYREAAEGAMTRVAVVAGEAGVGKSRVLYEFEKWLELLPEEILFFESQAVPETSHRPNGVFRDLFSFRFEIRDSDGTETVRKKFRSGMASLLEPDRAEVVGHWLGFDFSGSRPVAQLLGSRSFRQQAQADLIEVFRSMAADKPAVFFLEDLHWADEGSLDLIEQVASRVPDRRLLFVCLARPVLFDRKKGWGEGHEAFRRMDLQPLTEAQTRELVEEILQRMEAVPEKLRNMVVRAAQGNPFYVEELILLLMDRGTILVGEDLWRVDLEGLERVQVPGSLKGVLRARLDCLPSKERLLLQCASVVGRQFWGAAVTELSGEEGPEGDGPASMYPPLLEIARERQLIFPARASSFEASQEYSFKHALLRDIVYETVVKKMRRAYHAGAARWLERNLQDRQSEYLPAIAGHYEAAGESERAAEYLIRAGKEMAKVSAFQDAVSTFERAERLLGDGRPEQRAILLADLGDAIRVLGDHERARRCLEEAVGLARRTRQPRTEVAALNALARTAMIQGGYAEAKPYLAEALKLASRQGDHEGAAQVLLNLADVSFRLGDTETASTSGQQSLEIAKELRDAQGIAGAHRVLGFATMMRGDLERSAWHHQQGLEIFRTIGDRWGMATCYINLGEVHRKMGKIAEAVAFWEKSLPIAREIGARLSVAIAHLNTGGALAQREGSESRAFKNLKIALEEALDIGAMPLILEGLVGVALLYAREGQQPLAARLLGAAMAHPSFNAEIQEYSDPLLKQLRRKLDEETLRSLMDQGRGQEMTALVKDLIRNLAARPGD